MTVILDSININREQCFEFFIDWSRCHFGIGYSYTKIDKPHLISIDFMFFNLSLAFGKLKKK